LPINTDNGGGRANFREVKINPVDAIVKRVVIFGLDDTEFTGV
jgi:hypothetical protein